MINGKSILALITARGGSKGIPGKNIKALNSKPLIGWTIEAALNSNYVERVIVSSDSQEILEISRQFGADTPFVRPAELAGDLAKQEDAILHAMQWVEENDRPYDYILVLTPTNPLRDAREIDKVTEYLLNHPQAKAVMTVTECEHPPLQANVLPDDLSLKDFMPYELRLKNRQELPQYYQLSGSVCLMEWEYFKEQGSFLAPLTYAYITTARSGLDINNLKDFLLAEIYMENPDVS